jgi:hypothetical protein
MLVEHSIPDAIDARIEEPIDVVALVAPDQGGLSQHLVDALATMKTQGAAAVLVVFPRFVDAEILRRQADAGVDLLDTFWRTRSHRQ